MVIDVPKAKHEKVLLELSYIRKTLRITQSALDAMQARVQALKFSQGRVQVLLLDQARIKA